MQSSNLKSTVLVTGGCGFLGSHLAEYHLKKGASVICVDNFSTNSRSNSEVLKKAAADLNKTDHLLIIEADVTRNWDPWAKQIPKNILESLSHVFHFASPASPPVYQRLSLETLHVNSVGLENALNFATQHKARVVYASTSEIYGDAEINPQPETYWGNVNPYGERSCYDEAKRYGEALLFSFNKRFKTRHGLVRIFNTYGPRMDLGDGRVIINFLVQALKGQPLTVYGDGTQSRSFCYVSDLIEVIYRYAQSDIVEPVNIGNEGEFKIIEVAQAVQKLFSDKKLELEFLPLPKDDPKQRRPNISRAKEWLKWEPRIRLEEGLREMSAWIKTQNLT